MARVMIRASARDRNRNRNRASTVIRIKSMIRDRCSDCLLYTSDAADE